jgi:hypothetical protein
METDAAVEKQRTVFPQQLAKRLLAFRTVPTGPAAVKPTNNKTGQITCYKNRTFSLATDIAVLEQFWSSFGACFVTAL